jgi:drug/metabolite transporter (DMT)-like permease
VSQLAQLLTFLFRHSGLDPESSSVSLTYASGCRIKSGMTGRKWAAFLIIRGQLLGGEGPIWKVSKKGWAVNIFFGLTLIAVNCMVPDRHFYPPARWAPMNILTVRSNALLLITAAIWGFAFVAQRVGMEYLGPFTFNAARFILGSLSLLPLLFISRDQRPASENIIPHHDMKLAVFGGFAAGFMLFMGMSLQQVGLVYTTAGKAGFITSLYVVIVPILALFWKQSTNSGTWIGAVLAAIGLYFLSVTERFTVEFGDLLEFFCAFFWAGQVLIIGWLSPRIQSVKLAFTQFVVCAVLSLMVAVVFEDISWHALEQATLPILYGGILSSGVAFTFQVMAQRHTHPAHASIIMSLEAVFAAIGGWLLLNEILGTRGLMGCGLMLCGMLLSQLWGLKNKTAAAISE